MSRRIEIKNRTALNTLERSAQGTDGKLLFTAWQGHRGAFLIRDHKLAAVSIFPPQSGNVGAIHIGKVKNAVKNLNAWFVELELPGADAEGGVRTNCFLSQAQAPHPYLLNRSYDGRILEGDEILVQVIREAQKTKQPAVTTKITLADPEKEALLREAAHRTCYSVLRPAPAAWKNVLDYQVNAHEYTEAVTDDPALYETLLQSGRFQSTEKAGAPSEAPSPGQKPLRLYTDPAWSLAGLYRLDTLMDEALQRRVWLKSGGYLVIDVTEAMIVIDVNTGKCESRKTQQDLVADINREAAGEIARQLRLRSLSGMILIDFINMKSEAEREALLELMRELVRTDPTPVQVVDFTALGIMELTRKKGAPMLWEQLENSRNG